jgi:hypothetical protein
MFKIFLFFICCFAVKEMEVKVRNLNFIGILANLNSALPQNLGYLENEKNDLLKSNKNLNRNDGFSNKSLNLHVGQLNFSNEPTNRGFQFLVQRFTEDLSHFTFDKEDNNFIFRKNVIKFVIFALIFFLSLFIGISIVCITWKLVMIFYLCYKDFKNRVQISECFFRLLGIQTTR